jgi:hypothetical protein
MLGSGVWKKYLERYLDETGCNYIEIRKIRNHKVRFLARNIDFPRKTSRSISVINTIEVTIGAANRDLECGQLT